MKIILISTVIILMIAMPSEAQLFGMKKSLVPLSVKETFHKKYNDATVRKWIHEKNHFIATFSLNRKKHEAVFNDEGDWIRTEISIKWEELPCVVKKSYRATDFKWLDRNFVKVIDAPEKEKLYLIDGDNSDDGEFGRYCYFMLWFSEDGKMVKKESNCF
ncbi:MAG: PepSY-like domain-containing protein [Bacteroidales bacterium]|nr:PepSY-like domain-containing protein [Bacteroidales bacterium]